MQGRIWNLINKESFYLCLVAPVVSDSGTPWTVDLQALLSMGFSRQEYWNGLSCPSPGDLSKPEIEPASPAFQANSLPLSHQEILNYLVTLKNPMVSLAVWIDFFTLAWFCSIMNWSFGIYWPLELEFSLSYAHFQMLKAFYYIKKSQLVILPLISSHKSLSTRKLSKFIVRDTSFPEF